MEKKDEKINKLMDKIVKMDVDGNNFDKLCLRVEEL